MMPKTEHAARLAMRKSHRADAPVCKHKGEPGKSWVAGDRADKVRLNPRPFTDGDTVQREIDRAQNIALTNSRHGYGTFVPTMQQILSRW